MNKIRLLIVFCLFVRFTGAQTIASIDSIEKQYQSCLDQGTYMLGCTKYFYARIDSLLNARYQHLRASCNNMQKKNLRYEQMKWLAKRDRAFEQIRRRINQEAKAGGFDGGQDETMMVLDEKAKFVKNRLLELARARPRNYSARSGAKRSF